MSDGGTVRRHGPGYNFLGDPETGVTVRWGRTRGEDPARAPWPELADISVSNHCSAGCPYCYRDSRPDGSFLSVKDYEAVLDALTSPRWGPVFQVALGGGEPLEHPQLGALLRATRARGIVPNLTTRGLGLTRARVRVLRDAGAVALSISRLAELDPARVALLAGAGVRLNVHYLLHQGSLPEATAILEGRFDRQLRGVRSVIFLTYKPRGRAHPAWCVGPGPALDRFVEAVDARRTHLRVGFDACFVPLLLRHTAVAAELVDACECGFFSVYVDERLEVRPCSFAPPGHGLSLRERAFAEIWEEGLAPFRAAQTAAACARGCRGRGHCRGPCPYFAELGFCHDAQVA